MPHKRNPVGSAIAIACARRVQGPRCARSRRSSLEHERALGAWQAEWGALSDALAYAGGAAAAIRGVLEALEVDAGRMRANLDVRWGRRDERARLASCSPADRVREGEADRRGRAARAAESGGTLRDALAGST